MFNAQYRIYCLMLAAGYGALAWTAAPAFAAPRVLVQANDAWIRWLPAGLPAAGYVVLRNIGNKPVVLVGAESSDYRNTMLHETRNDDRVSEMVNVAKINIPAHGTIAFSPGGYHIMLMQARKQIKPGDIVPVTLQFEGGDELTLNFDVRNADGSGVSTKGIDMNSMHNLQH